MKIQRVVLIFVLVAIIFFATIAMFVYTTFTSPINSGRDNKNPSVEVPQQPTTTPPNTPPLSETDNLNVINGCIALKASLAQGKQYEKGSLIVTFLDLVSYEIALESLRFFKLTPDTSSLGKQNFNSYHWLSVGVPSGEEFKWQCLLEAGEGIKKANLNLTFNLRQ